MNFTKEEYKQRLTKVQKMMQEKGIELLISHDTNNLNYLTGYDAWSFYYAQILIREYNLGLSLEILIGQLQIRHHPSRF